MSRTRELAVVMLMANILLKLGHNLTSNVNSFRRKLRKVLNHIEKHEKKLYQESLTLASNSWESVNKEDHTNMSVASTLSSLYLLIEDVTWIKKKVCTPKQFILIYNSIVQDKPVALTAEIEANSKRFTDELSDALGFEKKRDLKRMIHIMRENKIIKDG